MTLLGTGFPTSPRKSMLPCLTNPGRDDGDLSFSASSFAFCAFNGIACGSPSPCGVLYGGSISLSERER